MFKTFLAISLLGFASPAARQDQATPALAVPRAAISAILELFQQYPVVALGEGPHNNRAGHEFRLSLIRDPRFATIVNDIVVEFGNARYQSLMDRFISGQDVPFAELREVWQNTTQRNTVWDKPMYHEFFVAVRDLNRTLLPGRRLRVLLGDPPIDWTTIKSAEDINPFYPQRSAPTPPPSSSAKC